MTILAISVVMGPAMKVVMVAVVGAATGIGVIAAIVSATAGAMKNVIPIAMLVVMGLVTMIGVATRIDHECRIYAPRY